MKRGFIRAFWGTSEEKYDEGWANPSGRHARMEDDIKMAMKIIEGTAKNMGIEIVS